MEDKIQKKLKVQVFKKGKKQPKKVTAVQEKIEEKVDTTNRVTHTFVVAGKKGEFCGPNFFKNLEKIWRQTLAIF